MIETVWAIDAMEATLDRSMIPAAVPVLFVYKTGTTQNPDIEWTEADISGLPQLENLTIPQVYRIHQGFGTKDPFRTDDGIPWDEIDLEAGAWTVSETLDAINKRNALRWSTRVYASDMPMAELENLATATNVSLRAMYWREANWSISRKNAQLRIGLNRRYAVQWASPSSNPLTLVPGTNITLQTANLDLTEVGLRGTGWPG